MPIERQLASAGGSGPRPRGHPAGTDRLLLRGGRQRPGRGQHRPAPIRNSSPSRNDLLGGVTIVHAVASDGTQARRRAVLRPLDTAPRVEMIVWVKQSGKSAGQTVDDPGVEGHAVSEFRFARKLSRIVSAARSRRPSKSCRWDSLPRPTLLLSPAASETTRGWGVGALLFAA